MKNSKEIKAAIQAQEDLIKKLDKQREALLKGTDSGPLTHVRDFVKSTRLVDIICATPTERESLVQQHKEAVAQNINSLKANIENLDREKQPNERDDIKSQIKALEEESARIKKLEEFLKKNTKDKTVQKDIGTIRERKVRINSALEEIDNAKQSISSFHKESDGLLRSKEEIEAAAKAQKEAAKKEKKEAEATAKEAEAKAKSEKKAAKKAEAEKKAIDKAQKEAEKKAQEEAKKRAEAKKKAEKATRDEHKDVLQERIDNLKRALDSLELSRTNAAKEVKKLGVKGLKDFLMTPDMIRAFDANGSVEVQARLSALLERYKAEPTPDNAKLALLENVINLTKGDDQFKVMRNFVASHMAYQQKKNEYLFTQIKLPLITILPDVIRGLNEGIKDPANLNFQDLIKKNSQHSKLTLVIKVLTDPSLSVGKVAALSLGGNIWKLIKIGRRAPEFVKDGIGAELLSNPDLDSMLTSDLVLSILRDPDIFKMLFNNREGLGQLLSNMRNDIGAAIAGFVPNDDPFPLKPETLLILIQTVLSSEKNIEHLQGLIDHLAASIIKSPEAFGPIIQGLGIQDVNSIKTLLEPLGAIVSEVAKNSTYLYTMIDNVIPAISTGQIPTPAVIHDLIKATNNFLSPELISQVGNLLTPDNVKSLLDIVDRFKPGLTDPIKGMDLSSIPVKPITQLLLRFKTVLSNVSEQDIALITKAATSIESITDQEMVMLGHKALEVVKTLDVASLIKDQQVVSMLQSEFVMNALKGVLPFEKGSKQQDALAKVIRDVIPAATGLVAAIASTETMSTLDLILPDLIGMIKNKGTSKEKDARLKNVLGGLSFILGNKDIQYEYANIAKIITNNRPIIKEALQEVIANNPRLRAFKFEDKHINRLIDAISNPELIVHLQKIVELASAGKSRYPIAIWYALTHLGVTREVIKIGVEIAKEKLYPVYPDRIKRWVAGSKIDRIIKEANQGGKDLETLCTATKYSGFAGSLVSSLNFSGQHIRSSMAEMNISGFDFSDATFKGDGVNLSGATLVNCKFDNIELEYVKKQNDDKEKGKKTKPQKEIKPLNIENVTMDLKTFESLLPLINKGNAVMGEKGIKVMGATKEDLAKVTVQGAKVESIAKKPAKHTEKITQRRETQAAGPDVSLI